MNQTVSIDEVVATNKDIVRKRGNVVPALAIFIIGSAMLAFSIIEKTNLNLSSSLLFIGAIIALIGVIMLLKPRKYLYCLSLHEPVTRKEMFFDVRDRSKASELLEAGKIDQAMLLAQKDSAPVRIVLYCCRSGKFQAAQIQEYVPYEYVPTGEVHVFHAAQMKESAR